MYRLNFDSDDNEVWQCQGDTVILCIFIESTGGMPYVRMRLQ